jgi:hypothetical protein
MTYRLDPITVARIKRSARCPDCDSIVDVNAVTGGMQVQHDDTCPTLARMEALGRVAYVVVSQDGTDVSEHAAVLADVLGMNVVETPYDGLMRPQESC